MALQGKEWEWGKEMNIHLRIPDWRLSGKLVRGADKKQGRERWLIIFCWPQSRLQEKKPNLIVRSLVPSDEEENINSSWLPEYRSCLASKLQRATLNMEEWGVVGQQQHVCRDTVPERASCKHLCFASIKFSRQELKSKSELAHGQAQPAQSQPR